MNAFWWFKKKSLAGMARPGFNKTHWLTLPFAEAAVLGWLGQYSQGPLELEDFRQHLKTYVPLIHRFHGVSESELPHAVRIFDSNEGLHSILERVRERTDAYEYFRIENDRLYFKLNEARLHFELSQFKSHGVRHIVSLTEAHHLKDFLSPHFTLHHLAVKDLHPPSIEQVEELASLVRDTQKKSEGLAVHCMAGIGRTSTMLMSAHIWLGEGIEEVHALVKKGNPSFVLTEGQAAFVRSVAARSESAKFK